MMMLSRFRGSLVAAVLGDCIGAYFEGEEIVELPKCLKRVKKIEQAWAANRQKAEGKKGKGLLHHHYTDDTAMLRCIAASIVDNCSVNVWDIATRFADEFRKEPNRGYGGNIITVLKALSNPDLKDIFQPSRDQFDGSGSYGNGGGMRISPLGLFFHHKSVEDLKESTVHVTALTHSHPHAIVGAILQSFAVHLALSLDNSVPLDTNRFLEILLERLQPVETEVYKADKERKRQEKGGNTDTESEREEHQELVYCTKLELIREFLTREVETDEVKDKLGTDISALRSVPTALYCFLRGATKSMPGIEERSEVEQTILYAISLGGDTDTVATMAAATAGAFFGVDRIPQAWCDSCEGVDDAMMYGEKLADIVT